MLPHSQGPADVLTRILAGEGITVWALGCSANCWGSHLCLEMALQRMLLRTWVFLEAARTRKYLRGCCCLVHCCFQYATGALPGSCRCHCMWEQPQELSFWALVIHGKLGRAGRQIFCILKLTSAPSWPWGGAERGRGWPRWAVLGFLPGTGRERLIPVQTLQVGRWESCTSTGLSRGGQKAS